MSPTIHGSSSILSRPSTITPLSLEELWSDDGILLLLVDVGANPNAKLAFRMHIIAATLAVHFILYCMRSSDYYHYGSGEDGKEERYLLGTKDEGKNAEKSSSSFKGIRIGLFIDRQHISFLILIPAITRRREEREKRGRN